MQMDIMLTFRKNMTLLPFSAKWYAEISRAEEFEASTSWAGEGYPNESKNVLVWQARN